MSALDEVSENHPLINRLSRRCVIANFDEREAFELQRRLDCTTAHEWDPGNPLVTASNPDMLSKFLNTAVPSPDDKCYGCVWLPLCGGGCPQLRLFGKPVCPAYRDDPEAFVLAMHARIRMDK